TISSSEEQRMEAVDELRDVGHDDLVRVAMKRIECQRGKQRVAHRRLLTEEMTWIDFGAGPMPGSPLVDDELHAAAPIHFAHHGPVTRDEALHSIGFVEELVPLVAGEVDRIALAGIPVGGRAAADVPRVVVQRPPPQTTEAAFPFFSERGEKSARPAQVAPVGSGADEREVDTVPWHPLDETSKFDGILLGREIAAAPPGLVADAPEANAKRIAFAGSGPHVRECRAARRAVAVLDPLIEVTCGKAAHVRSNVRLCTGESTQTDEFVRAELIGVVLRWAVGQRGHRIGPEVRPARTSGARADTVAPFVAVREAATRPANDAGGKASHMIDERLADAVGICRGRRLSH